MKKLLLCLLILLLIHPISPHASSENQLSFIVKTSSQSLFQSVLTVESDRLYKSLVQAKPVNKVAKLPPSNHYLLFEDEGMVKVLMMDDSGVYYNLHQKEKLNFDPETNRELNTYFTVLSKKHFGKTVDWEEAQELFPRYAKFKVTDLDTGLSFYVQRRAGSNHADVQPLTRKDTKIMKKIYDGNWSWKRRAVVVYHNNEAIAASMHGMPHGRGALANGFPGHFCIHFKGSTTHTTKKADLSHQVMVYKAGGKLTQFVKGLSAKDIVELFFIAVNQNDLDLLELIYHGDTLKQKEAVDKIESIRIVNNQQKPTVDEPFIYEAPVEYKVKEKGKREVDSMFSFRVFRDSLTTGWQLEDIPIGER